MAVALEEARRGGASGEVPVGAVVVREGSLLGQDHNRPIGLIDPTGHAEVLALRAAAATAGEYRLPGATLYVTIEPCVMCLGAALHARIERVVYGAHDPKGGACGSVVDLRDVAGLNHRIGVRSGVLDEAAAQLVRAFFVERRRGRGITQGE